METRTCAVSGKSFVITDEDLEFYAQLGIMPPTICPEERWRQLMAWRNERVLYVRKCDKTQKDILSVFVPESDWTVYDSEEWYSDSWDGLDYGVDFDFSREFFPQFFELAHRVPQLSRSIVNNYKCDYVNQCGWCKESYLIFEADQNENCLYSNNIYDSRHCSDCTYITNCELCYECIDCRDCYEVKYSQNSKNCSDSWFLKNCIGCKNCFGCVNLRNKEYHFMNERCTPEEFRQKLEQINLTSFQGLQDMRESFATFSQKFPHKYYEGTQNENSTGNGLYNTQRCQNCFDVNNSQDCKNVYDSRNMKKCQDIQAFGAPRGAQFCYFCHEIGEGVNNIVMSDQAWVGSYNVYYSKLCIQNTHDVFGCVGLRKKEYCIFNKQYDQVEYEKLREKIIAHMKETGEWGQFFPTKYSPFPYNDTMAQMHLPLDQNEAKQKGFWWREEKSPPQNTSPKNPPENIADTSDDILKEVFTCAATGKPYQIQLGELKFYRKLNLPIPPLHHDERFRRRMALRTPRKLWERTCANSGEKIHTSYAPERPEKILSEAEYLKTVE